MAKINSPSGRYTTEYPCTKYSVNTLLRATRYPLSSTFGPVIYELCDLGSVHKFLKNSVSSFAKFALCHYKNILYWTPESESHSVVSNFWYTMDYTVHGILQARILEWVTFPFYWGSSQPRDWTQVSHIAGGFFTSWATREAQEYWSGWPIPSPEDLPNPQIEPGSPALQADSLPTELSYL